MLLSMCPWERHSGAGGRGVKIGQRLKSERLLGQPSKTGLLMAWMCGMTERAVKDAFRGFQPD